MGRVNNDNWLDEALDKAIHSDDTQPDFATWTANHPEAVKMLTSRTPQVQRPHRIRRILMNNMYVKLAAAAVIVIAAIVAIAQFAGPNDKTPTSEPVAAETLTGPMIHAFADGSNGRLAQGAIIRTYGEAGKRGFEHVAGRIDVTVAQGLGEFIVTTPYGDVKALGTQFMMELVDGVTADTKEPVNLLAVEVTEGKVEVSNTQGRTTLGTMEDTIVEKDAPPYDFNQDEALPARLKERIQAMVAAFEAGDATAWAANFNMDYAFKLGKGQVEYDPLLFGGSKQDAERLQEMLVDVQRPEELSQIFIDSVNITEPVKIYVRHVKLSADGNHATAECVQRKSHSHMVRTGPQWHYFDNDWWQIDD